MLDDDTGRSALRRKTLDTFPGRVGVGNVVVAQLLALQLLGRHQRTRCRLQVPIKSRLLVRIFTVTQVLQLDKTCVRLRREQLSGGRADSFFKVD